jgi:hypothetical protein
MELLDRYLQAVKKHLPWKRQDDIVAELKANLEAQLDEKEAALGRPLTNDEGMAWLKQLGSPIQMAAPYQTQQYLIGPAIFPTYRYVLQLACVWSLAISLIVNVVKIAAEDNANPAALLAALQHVPFTLLLTAAWVTLIFVVIEYAVTHSKTKWMPPAAPSAGWSPTELPPLEEGGVAGRKPRSYPKAVAEVIFGFLFLTWLLLVPGHPYLLVGPGAPYLLASPYKFAPVCMQFFWWVVALNALQLAWRCVELLRGSWQRPHPAMRLAIPVLGLIPLTVLIAAPDHALMLLKHPALDQARYGGSLVQINKGLYEGVLIMFGLIALQLAWEIGRMSLGLYRKRVGALR